MRGCKKQGSRRKLIANRVAPERLAWLFPSPCGPFLMSTYLPTSLFSMSRPPIQIIPNSSNAPGAGFLGNLSASVLGGPPQGVISWELRIVNNTIAAAEALAMPLLKRIGNLSSEISFEVHTAHFPDFASYGASFNGLQEVGVNALVGGRFLDTASLQHNHTFLKQTLKAAVAPTGGLLLGEPLMAEGAWKAIPRGGDNALSDAWRSAVTNLRMSINIQKIRRTTLTLS